MNRIKSEIMSLVSKEKGTKLNIMKSLFLGMVLVFFVTSSWAQKYDYDKAGRLVRVTYPSGKKVYYYYDKAGNLISVRDAKKTRKELRAETKNVSAANPLKK